MDWIPIGEPNIPELSPDAKAVRDYITENRIAQITHMNESVMCRALHMRHNRLQDAVYEYRKWESIMARKPKFNKEQRAEMLRLHNKERYSVGKLASKFGCSQTAVKTALQAAKIEAEDAAPDKHTPLKDIAAEVAGLEDCENGISNTPLMPKKTQISPEFDVAVDEMTVESRSADAEENFANAVPDKLPHYIWVALDDQVSAINWEIEQREQRIAELKEELAKLEDRRSAIEQWVEEQKWQ